MEIYLQDALSEQAFQLTILLLRTRSRTLSQFVTRYNSRQLSNSRKRFAFDFHVGDEIKTIAPNPKQQLTIDCPAFIRSSPIIEIFSLFTVSSSFFFLSTLSVRFFFSLSITDPQDSHFPSRRIGEVYTFPLPFQLFSLHR